MAQKEFYNMSKLYIYITLIAGLLFFTCTSFAEDKTTVIELIASNEFQFVDQNPSAFTIKPLDSAHKSVESLKEVEAIGVVYLGNITLVDDATPLSALREVSAQITRKLDLNFALIADSTTSQSLNPHDLLLLYHPSMTITLGLTKIPDSNAYSLIGTYAMPSTSDTQTEAIE